MLLAMLGYIVTTRFRMQLPVPLSGHLPFTAAEIYFDPAVVGGATEQEVIDALIRAGRR
jgi:hypothetical protein